MSYISDGQNGLEAVEKKQWDEAIVLLSRALEHSENPSWLLGRSHAYQEKREYDLALEDAEHAYVSATERQNTKVREIMVLAQYRRAVILGHLKRYADADACCIWSQQIIEGKNFRREPDDVATHVDADGEYLATPAELMDSPKTMPVNKDAATAAGVSGGTGTKPGATEWTRAFVWRSTLLHSMAKLPKGDPGRKITVSRIPQKPAKKEKKVESKTVAPSTPATPASPVSTDSAPVSTEAAPEPTKAAPASAPAKWATKKLRVDFYQKPDTVNLVLYAKGADKDKVQVDVLESEVHLTNLPEATIGSTWAFLDLDGQVDTQDKTIRVTPFKIELTLKKKAAGEKWAVWGTQREEGSGAPPSRVLQEGERTGAGAEEKDTAPTPEAAPQLAIKFAPVVAASTEKGKEAEPQQAPSDATGKPPAYPSSSRTAKDWNKLDLGEEEEDDSDVNTFFKKLYAGSTPEQQRAMAKSFIESNGTSLSTDWNTVSKGPVPTQPPDGVEAKKW